ncbi:MAG: LysR family transcriptional regulator [Allopontixanthobacter sediminis]
MKSSHFRLILKIAETGKLQIAANALAISQPAASRILAEIEREVGTPLFTRHPAGMEPTPVGDAFVRHAKVILAELTNLEDEVENIAIGHIGEVRVGSVTGPAIGYLVPAILEIKKTSPMIELTVEIGPSTALVRGLEEGRFDFVIGRLPPDHDSRAFKVMPARREIVSLIARKGHPLAGRQNLPLSELAGYDWVIQERGSPIRQAVEQTFHSEGLATPAGITNSSSLLVMLAILAQSDAVAPMTEEVATLLTGPSIGANLSVLDVRHPMTVSPYFIIQNRVQPLTRAAQIVLEQVVSRL